MKTNKILGLSVIALLSLAPLMEAGKIGPLVDQASPSHSSGFGGWNLDNVTVKMTDLDYDESSYTQSFDKTTGFYPTMTYGDSFESDIHDSIDETGTVMAHLHGKDWPVGEPSGIKIIEGNYNEIMNNGDPTSCIITTSFVDNYLDNTNPTETLCDSEFQSHKRFKLNLLPSMYISDDAYGNGVNLTFNVEDSPSESWRYMVLQKINNYTDKRLDGYKIEIGFIDGTTGTFTKSTSTELTLSIGIGEDTNKTPAIDVWDYDDLATFSNGLFGAIDDHFDTNGFFDDIRAGFNVSQIDEYTIESGTTLGSNYNTLFGDWVPEIWAPKGLFWDDDNDPETDAEVMAFWADTGIATGVPTSNYAWLKGNEDNFVEATALELATWASSSAHEVDIIEDVLNLGLNYIVKIGDITTFPTTANNTFTIRITPHFAPTTEQVEPGYVSNTPPPLSDYLSEKGTVSITPAPTFVIGNSLTLLVADKGLNTNASGIETVDINVITSLGENETITLTEIGEDRGVFTVELLTVVGSTKGTDNDNEIVVTEGTVVTATYTDADIDGAGGGTAIVTATTTASITPVEETTSTTSGGGSGDVNDNISLLFTIFGFLLIGGLIVRRKLA